MNCCVEMFNTFITGLIMRIVSKCEYILCYEKKIKYYDRATFT